MIEQWRNRHADEYLDPFEKTVVVDYAVEIVVDAAAHLSVMQVRTFAVAVAAVAEPTSTGS